MLGDVHYVEDSNLPEAGDFMPTRRLHAFALALLLALPLALPEAAPAAPPEAQAAPVAGPMEGRGLAYADTDAFDRRLADSLEARPLLQEVLLPVPAPLATLPARLDKWLSAVEKTGGTVEARALPDAKGGRQRSFLSAVADIALYAYDAYQTRTLLRPVARYNAVVHYDGESRTVRRVSFMLRSGGGGQAQAQ